MSCKLPEAVYEVYRLVHIEAAELAISAHDATTEALRVLLDDSYSGAENR